MSVSLGRDLKNDPNPPDLEREEPVKAQRLEGKKPSGSRGKPLPGEDSLTPEPPESDMVDPQNLSEQGVEELEDDEDDEIIEEEVFLKAMVYGAPGVGKTTLLASGHNDPRLWPGVLLDFEGGTLSVRSRIRRVALSDFVRGVEPAPGRIDVIRIESWGDFDKVTQRLWNDDRYKLVAVDSLTEVNYLCQQYVVGEARKRDRTHAEDSVELQDYLRSSNRMRSLIRELRDMPIHTVFAAGLKEDQNPKTKRQQRRPALTGQLGFEVVGLLSIVGLLDTYENDQGQTARELITYPDDSWIAKDRSEGGLLGDTLHNPTLPKILDLLQL